MRSVAASELRPAFLELGTRAVFLRKALFHRARLAGPFNASTATRPDIEIRHAWLSSERRLGTAGDEECDQSFHSRLSIIPDSHAESCKPDKL
jgi:hypothetical protein